MKRRTLLSRGLASIVAILVALPATAAAAVTGRPRTVPCRAKWGAFDPGSIIHVNLTAVTPRPIAMSQYIPEMNDFYTVVEI